MSTTTSTAIRDAIVDLTTSLSPTGMVAGGRARYVPAAPGVDWDHRSESDWDREFTIGLLNEGQPLMFGAVNEIDYQSTFELKIGHIKGTDARKGLDRVNEDVLQIREQLEKKSNYPEGVHLIRLTGISSEERSKGWLTTLRFDLVYSRAAP